MIIDEEVEEFFIEHFGKKGMKWGVRNKIKSIGRRTGLFIKRHPGASAAIAASTAAGAAFITRRLLKKIKVKSLPPLAIPSESMFRPKSDALYQELKNWRVVDTAHSRELARELTNWRMR